MVTWITDSVVKITNRVVILIYLIYSPPARCEYRSLETGRLSEKTSSDRFAAVVTGLRRRWVQAPTGRTVFLGTTAFRFVFTE
jgi:hypothetical protein